MLNELIADLKKLDKTEAAYKTGVSIHTIESIVSGRCTNPKLNTVLRLQEFIKEKNNELASKS